MKILEKKIVSFIPPSSPLEEMSTENSTAIADSSSSISEVPIPRSVRLILLVTLDVPSLLCTLILLSHLVRDRLLRHSLHHHVVIVLLFTVLATQLIDIPLHIIYLLLGRVWPANRSFCLFWLFISIGIFDCTGILLAYAAIERHLLVFHHQWLRTFNRRLVLHYIPLFSVLFYSLSFYLYAIVFPPCETLIDYTQPWCSYPCYYDEHSLSLYDSIANVIIPALVIVLFNLLLIVRFLTQRRRLNLRNQWRKHRRMNLRNQWRKHRRMIVQLLSLSSLLIVFNLPLILLMLAHLCGVPSDVGLVFSQYAYFFTYFIPLLMPFVCLGSLPDVYGKITKFISEKWNRIQPTIAQTIVQLAQEH